MKIVIYGDNMSALGAAGVLARAGNDVFIPLTKQELDSKRMYHSEPGLRSLLVTQFEAQRLHTYDLYHPPEEADMHWLNLDSSDYATAERIVKSLGAKANGRLLIINQSIFGIGATQQLADLLPDPENQTVVYMHDNYRGGVILESIMRPDQLIVGTECRWAMSKISAMSRVLMSARQRIRFMSTVEAEFSSLALNGMLAMRLSYINELASLADNMGVDIERVKDTIGGDSRVGKHFLNPGCGFGGQKFSSELLLFSNFLKENHRSSLLRTVIDMNEQQKETLFRKFWRHRKGNLKGTKVAIWGASYKPATADIHNAPSITTINALMAQGVEVRVHDPMALENLAAHYRNASQLMLCSTPEQAVEGADALMVITEWPEYSMRDFAHIVTQMRDPLLLDGRNIYDPGEMVEYGFTYQGIGRKAY